MLVRLTPYVNFINVLSAAFTRADPKSIKKTVSQVVSLLMLLGSTRVKAVGRTLVKLTPDLLSSLFLLIYLPFYLAENLCFLLSLSPLSFYLHHFVWPEIEDLHFSAPSDGRWGRRVRFGKDPRHLRDVWPRLGIFHDLQAVKRQTYKYSFQFRELL